LSDEAEDLEALAWIPINVIGVGAEWFRGVAEEAEDHGGGGGEVSQPFREARPASPVTVLIPPAVLDEEDAVFDLPVIAHRGQQFVGGDRTRIDAGQEVARVGEPHRAIVSGDIAVHAQGNLTAGEAERFADVSGVL